jgi:hypothetical protein
MPGDIFFYTESGRFRGKMRPSSASRLLENFWRKVKRIMGEKEIYGTDAYLLRGKK